MKQFFLFVRKEFLHVLRDPKTLLILFGMPVVQVLLFGFVLSNEIKDTRIIVVDYAHDVASQQLTAKIEASDYFDVEKNILTHQQIEQTFLEGKIKAAVIFPANFYNDLMHDKTAQVQIITDATDINTSNLVSSYLNAIISDYQTNLISQGNNSYRIIPEIRMLYNPQLLGAPNFVPGVMAMVLLLVCVMMTAIAIVREKERGTMEVLLVSPFKPSWIILSKAAPYLILSLLDLTAILLLSVFVLDLPIKGSLLLLVAESSLFILTCLTLGILISIQTSSQLVAMMISLGGMMLPTILLSGFMFPVENMPVALQVLSNIVPSRWYYIIVKEVMIKGAGFSSVWKETLILAGMTMFFFLLSMKQFKIRLQ
ncbi:MAG: ABC transporter permease [Chitinophagales bacterium]